MPNSLPDEEGLGEAWVSQKVSTVFQDNSLAPGRPFSFPAHRVPQPSRPPLPNWTSLGPFPMWGPLALFPLRPPGPHPRPFRVSAPSRLRRSCLSPYSSPSCALCPHSLPSSAFCLSRPHSSSHPTSLSATASSGRVTTAPRAADRAPYPGAAGLRRPGGPRTAGKRPRSGLGTWQVANGGEASRDCSGQPP